MSLRGQRSVPWSPADAPSHTKSASTPALRQQWAAVANEVRERLLKEGYSEEAADAQAIRRANGVVRRV